MKKYNKVKGMKKNSQTHTHMQKDNISRKSTHYNLLPYLLAFSNLVSEYA